MLYLGSWTDTQLFISNRVVRVRSRKPRAAPPSCLLWGDPILMIVFREYEIVSVQSLISGWEMLHAVPTYLGIIKIVPDRNRFSLGW